MKKSLFRKPSAPAKPRPKKPRLPMVAEPIEPVNAPLYPPIEDLYPHLGPDQMDGDNWRARPMPPVTRWRGILE